VKDFTEYYNLTFCRVNFNCITSMYRQNNKIKQLIKQEIEQKVFQSLVCAVMLQFQSLFYTNHTTCYAGLVHVPNWRENVLENRNKCYSGSLPTSVPSQSNFMLVNSSLCPSRNYLFPPCHILFYHRVVRL
jgi:hypothetical protein